jgi:hypothetical protein
MDDNDTPFDEEDVKEVFRSHVGLPEGDGAVYLRMEKGVRIEGSKAQPAEVPGTVVVQSEDARLHGTWHFMRVWRPGGVWLVDFQK